MGIPLYLLLFIYGLFLILYIIFSLLNFFVFFKWGFASLLAYIIVFGYIFASLAVIGFTVYQLWPIDWTQNFSLFETIDLIEY
jgi:hypothetical protein